MESTHFRVSAAIKAQPPSSQSCAVQPAGPGHMTSAGDENVLYSSAVSCRALKAKSKMLKWIL